MKIPEIFKSRTFITVCLVSFLAVYFILGSLMSCYHEKNINSQVDKQQTNTNAARSRAAADAEQSAAIAAREREIEDRVRAASITPKLHRARANSDKSRLAGQAAQQKYEASKIPHFDSVPDSVLHERNCLLFTELYPGYRIENCGAR